MDNGALQVQDNETISILDNMDSEQITGTLNKIAKFQKIINTTLTKDQDFGVISGTSKPTLLKPGAEKILMLLGLTSEYEIVDKIEDYDKGVFAYTIKCVLLRSGIKITEGVGSCNSKEDKYRWRWVKEGDLPEGTYIDDLKTKDNGYGKTLYRIENDEIFSQANTILKMAKKRAQIDATLTVGALSQIFTQDIEDMSQFQQQERTETMTTQDALNMKLTFGKHKGQTLKEINTDNAEYIEWLSKNAKDNVIKKACKMVMENSFSQGNNQEPEKQADENEQNQEAKEVCADCGKPSNIGAYTKQKYGRVLCQACLKKVQQTEDETIYEGTPLA
jgi:hypothetical protein